MEAHNGKCIIRYILHHKLRRAGWYLFQARAKAFSDFWKSAKKQSNRVWYFVGGESRLWFERVWLCGITVNISQTGFEFAFFGFCSMSPTYQLPSLSEFYLKADFSFTVAKLIISPSLPPKMRQGGGRYSRGGCIELREYRQWVSASGELPPTNKLPDRASLFLGWIFIAISLVNSFQIFWVDIETFTSCC